MIDSQPIVIQAGVNVVQSWGVLGIVPFGGPNVTFAKPIETFFELVIMSAPSFHKGCGYELK